MRIDQITFSRFIAAISIVVFHYGKNIFPFNLPLFSFLFEQANIGVSYFFLLSGFVMIIAYGKNNHVSPIKYYQNRFGRIYPVYLLAIVLLFLWHRVVVCPIDYYGAIYNILAVQSWGKYSALRFNYPGWSISVEVLFYAVFPLLFNTLYTKVNYRIVATFAIIVWIVSQFILNYNVAPIFNDGLSTDYSTLLYYPLMHLNEFLLGNAAGLFFINHMRSKQRNNDWFVVLAFLGVIAALKFPLGFNYHDGLLAVFFIPMIILLASSNGWLSRVMQHKSLIFLGEASYGVYILQYPMFLLVNHYLVALGIYDQTIIFYASLFILVITSSLSYVYIETPLREKIRRIRLVRDVVTD